MARSLDSASIAADLCEIARGVTSRRALHDAWLDVFAPIGYDRAIVFDDNEVPGPMSTLAARNPLELSFENARRDAHRYLADYPVLRQRAATSRDVLVITPQDRWLRVYQEQFLPRGERSALVIALHGRGRGLSVITLSRYTSKQGFNDQHVNFAANLAPILSVGDLAWIRPPEPESPAVDSLRGRERDIALLIMKGLTNSEIASLLGSSPNTVRNQVANIFRKLGVSTRAELAGLR